jgi:hypothetical protein
MTDALKVHLRVFEVHRTTLRVVTLRPQTGVRFTSNYFHDTWHIVGGPDAASILGRLLWGLAFQKQPGTLVMIDHAHLVPTPFEADPADPILLVPEQLTRVDVDVLRALKLRLRRSPGPVKTIRWHTFGMAAALADDRPAYRRRSGTNLLESRERMSRRAGFVCFTAPAELLRSHALGIANMGGDGYHPMAVQRGPHWHYDGEFQVVDDFYRDVSAAKVARREVLGDDRPIASDDERWAIYRQKDRVLRRDRSNRS